jgi:hypothetical protein
MAQPEPTHPLIAMAVSVLLMLLLWPLAKASGRASGDRLRSLKEDLRQGRTRGYLVLAMVAAILIASFLEPRL